MLNAVNLTSSFVHTLSSKKKRTKLEDSLNKIKEKIEGILNQDLKKTPPPFVNSPPVPLPVKSPSPFVNSPYKPQVKSTSSEHAKEAMQKTATLISEGTESDLEEIKDQISNVLQEYPENGGYLNLTGKIPTITQILSPLENKAAEEFFIKAKGNPKKTAAVLTVISDCFNFKGYVNVFLPRRVASGFLSSEKGYKNVVNPEFIDSQQKLLKYIDDKINESGCDRKAVLKELVETVKSGLQTRTLYLLMELIKHQDELDPEDREFVKQKIQSISMFTPVLFLAMNADQKKEALKEIRENSPITAYMELECIVYCYMPIKDRMNKNLFPSIHDGTNLYFTNFDLRTVGEEKGWYW
ncbi:MAG: hypothetical protein IM537_20900 [Pseudanabaena sp. M57BS1SP1A06MG]|nr:hypothetical protein [Pseudanabaena sp. M57BS1SP1A06MG]